MYKLFGTKAVFVSVLIIAVYALFSKDIVTYTMEQCTRHVYGKKIFRLTFPFFYNIFNPSIAKIPSGHLCAIRCSTLTQKNIFYYLYGQFFYDSFILFLEIDHQGNCKIIRPVHKNLKGYLEDPRIIIHGDRYILSASEYVNAKNNFPVLMIYDKNYNFVKRTDYISTATGIQKNWCLFEHNGEIYVHTDTYPTWKVFKLDVDTGNMDKITDKEYGFQPRYHLRCSTSWKIYDEKHYICGLHTKTKEKMPTIRSILVLIDRKTLLPSFRTDLLCLDPTGHNRTQFLSGLEVDDFHVILSYGLNDSEIVLRKISKHRINFFPYES